MSAGPFSQSYAEARAGFLAAAGAAGLAVQSHPHPLPGRDGEDLALDVARFGPVDARAVLLVSSACHGVEGFCGSGLQTALLADRAFLEAAGQSGVAVVLLHALNPHGFSWWRRATHENVDLNRNFVDFDQPLPANPLYDEIAHLVVPDQWPPSEAVQAGVAAFATTHGGIDGLQAVVSGGQYTQPNGLFYGGLAPTWSQRTLRRVLREHGARCARLGWIDLHTGLGPEGVGERILATREDATALARARAWWGAGITSIYDGSSTSAPLVGLMWTAAYDECPQAEYTGIALEFGTVPILELIDALRADQWLQNHPGQADPAQRAAIERAVRDAFYIDTPAWRRSVLEQGFEAARQAIEGLAAGVSATAAAG